MKPGTNVVEARVRSLASPVGCAAPKGETEPVRLGAADPSDSRPDHPSKLPEDLPVSRARANTTAATTLRWSARFATRTPSHRFAPRFREPLLYPLSYGGPGIRA